MISLFVLNFDLKIKIEFGLGLVAIKFGFGYKFANWKSSTQIEFEIYNDFENCLATGASTRCEDQLWLKPGTGMDPGPRSPNNKFIESGRKC